MKLIKRSLIAMALSAGVGAPALAAEQPMPPEADLSTTMPPSERQQAAATQAEAHRQRVQAYRRMGAWVYKSGLLRHAELQVARYEAEARASLLDPAWWGLRTAEAERYARMAQQYRSMGGSAYRTGLVDWAERQARRHGDPQPGWTPEGVGAPPPVWWKPWLLYSL